MARIFVTRELPGPALARLRADHETTVWPEPLPPSYERAARARGPLTRAAFAADRPHRRRADRGRAEPTGVANYAVGYDNIDVDAATARGIQVGNTPDALTEATADLAFALLMAAARRITEAAAFAHSGDWQHLGAGRVPRRRHLRRDARNHRPRAHRAGGRAPRCRLRDGGAHDRDPRPEATSSICCAALTSSRSTCR